jgi:hypothetical protein
VPNNTSWSDARPTWKTLACCIDAAVAAQRFRRIEPTPTCSAAPLLAAWRRRTLNTNRGIALLSADGMEQEPGALAQGSKRSVGKALGYFPFFYELGPQTVLCGRGLTTSGLGRWVDAYNNQRVVLQSLFLVDLSAWDWAQARTWGQVLSGTFQDAIQRGIEDFLEDYAPLR